MGIWLCWLWSKFFVFARVLCTHNGRSLQTKKFAQPPCQIPIFQTLSVYRSFRVAFMIRRITDLDRSNFGVILTPKFESTETFYPNRFLGFAIFLSLTKLLIGFVNKCIAECFKFTL